MIRALAMIALLASPFSTSAQQQRFDEWTVDCSIDSMTDEKTCLVVSTSLGLVVQKGAARGVMVGMNHFPGSVVMLRLDDEPMRTARAPGFGGREAIAIIERLPTAQLIRTRYKAWPDKHMDEQVSPKGLTEALQYAINATKGAK